MNKQQRNRRRKMLAAAFAALSLNSTAHATCLADFDGINGVTVADLFDFLDAWFAQYGVCTTSCSADVDGLNNVDVGDLFTFLDAWFAGCTTPTPSLSVSPLTGGLGTVITLSVDPAGSPFQFDSNTTANWSGRFVGTNGTSDAFNINFSAAEVQEVSASEAKIVLGAGSGTLPVGIDALGLGTFQGTFNVDFGSGNILMKVIEVTPATSEAGEFRMVVYHGGYDSIDPPQLGNQAGNVEILVLSIAADPTHTPEEVLLNAVDAHYAAVVKVVQSSESTANAPSSMFVDIVTFDSNGDEFSRLEDVELYRNDSDGDTDYIAYQSDMLLPIIIVDTEVDATGFVEARPVYAAQGGTIGIVPAMP